MKQHWKFFASAAAALVWLWVSAALAVPWVRGAALHLPFAYVVFVVAGVALLPAYLMGAMFLSNLLHRKLPPRFHPGCRPVSVIVCARNEEKGIYGTIGSIARQQYDGRVTILCVDNGSTDGTLAEMRRAAADFSRPGRIIRLYGCCEPGKARALNEGLRHVRDEYFVTVDADTRLETSALAAIVGRIAATGAGCVAGNLVSAGARTWVQKMQFWDYFVSIAAIKRYQGSYGATLVARGPSAPTRPRRCGRQAAGPTARGGHRAHLPAPCGGAALALRAPGGGLHRRARHPGGACPPAQPLGPRHVRGAGGGEALEPAGRLRRVF